MLICAKTTFTKVTIRVCSVFDGLEVGTEVGTEEGRIVGTGLGLLLSRIRYLSRGKKED